MIIVVPAAEARTTETPNAVMTTLASPTLGETTELSLWRVEMDVDQQGPWHTFDAEQLWTVDAGTVRIATTDGDAVLGVGDTAVLPAGIERQITALTDARVTVCGSGTALALARGDAEPRPTPAWIA
jgi:quercetin dioxygenase-like cupin family protein